MIKNKFLIFLIFFFIFCSTTSCVVTPSSGQREISLMSEKDEKAIGKAEHPKIIKQFGGTYEDGGFDVQQTTDGGYILTGKTLYAGGVDSDLYLIKTDGNGNVSSIFNIPPSSKRKLKKTVNILGKEIISDQNNLFIEIYDDGSSEKKLIIEN